MVMLNSNSTQDIGDNHTNPLINPHIDGLVEDRGNTSVLLPMVIPHTCTYQSMYPQENK